MYLLSPPQEFHFTGGGGEERKTRRLNLWPTPFISKFCWCRSLRGKPISASVALVPAPSVSSGFFKFCFFCRSLFLFWGDINEDGTTSEGAHGVIKAPHLTQTPGVTMGTAPADSLSFFLRRRTIVPVCHLKMRPKHSRLSTRDIIKYH